MKEGPVPKEKSLAEIEAELKEGLEALEDLKKARKEYAELVAELGDQSAKAMVTSFPKPGTSRQTQQPQPSASAAPPTKPDAKSPFSFKR